MGAPFSFLWVEVRWPALYEEGIGGTAERVSFGGNGVSHKYRNERCRGDREK